MIRATGLLRLALITLVGSGISLAAFGQASADVTGPSASHGGKVELLPAKPVDDASDPVNRWVMSETVDGLVLAITIDGDAVRLDSATPARVPRVRAKPDRDTGGGDTVKATAFAGGSLVATTVVPDNVVNASEGTGLVRLTRRQISLVLVSDGPIDTVTIEAPATGARKSLDVRAVYARICEADAEGKWCGRRQR